ncbi:MAG: hypothetical protein JWN79_1215 [Gemmatimonadetes bacterium]|jgi:hypothetical protein|nr:hypothetical protein [Gemmatimonadota bacterium]
MKGRITPKLERILQDKNARGQLGQLLSRGEDGQVNLGGKLYGVRVEKQRTSGADERTRKTDRR